MGVKKTKISSTKRAHHLKQKKHAKNPFKKQNVEKNVKKSSDSSTPALENLKSLKVKKNVKKKDKKEKYGMPPIPEQDDVSVDDVMDMLDDEELENLTELKLDKNIQFTMEHKKRTRKRKNIEHEEEMDEHEKKYKDSKKIEKENEEKLLLPIKTSRGDIIERKQKVVKQKPLEKIENDDDNEMEMEEISAEDTDSDEDILKDESDSKKTGEIQNFVSTTDLLIRRDQEIAKQKYRIGIICSGILEKPEDKLKNFKALLQLMESKNEDGSLNIITVRKIATVSVLELFKDILPEYRLGFLDTKSQKMKKQTIERVNFENNLLHYFKKYLQLLEKFTKLVLRRGQNNTISPDSHVMAEICVKCLCEILLAHPYFNYSTNIAQMLVYLGNSKNESIRKMVEETFIEIFKTDQKFDLTLFIIRRVNHLIKSRSNNVYLEVITPILHLPIKSINLEAEKIKELKQKRLESHKSRLMNLSRREKKRIKKLKEVDKELQEAKAEENKQNKQQKLTEITKMMFTIYFRILKNDPNSKLLSSALEGVAKFSHTINIEFFEDIVNVLNKLIEKCQLGYREQLHCIQTVFVMLSGQGEAFNIDPSRFYTHLYKNLLSVHAGKNHNDLLIIIQTLGDVLIKRRKYITQKRLMAFIKRIGTLSLQVQHNGCLALLSFIKTALQFCSSLDLLLDTDNSVGSGRYYPDMDEPEYCNSNCTSLYEMILLESHYHPIVKKMAKHISFNVPTAGEGNISTEIAKISAEEFFNIYDSSQMSFNPAIPTPKSSEPKAKYGKHFYLDSTVEEYCKAGMNKAPKICSFDFYKNYSDEIKKINT